MTVNGDTGEVVGTETNPLARDVEKVLNDLQWPLEDGTYEDMYFILSTALDKLVRDLRRALFKHGTER